MASSNPVFRIATSRDRGRESVHTGEQHPAGMRPAGLHGRQTVLRYQRGATPTACLYGLKGNRDQPRNFRGQFLPGQKLSCNHGNCEIVGGFARWLQSGKSRKAGKPRLRLRGNRPAFRQVAVSG
jgi:hypothetical protein